MMKFDPLTGKTEKEPERGENYRKGIEDWENAKTDAERKAAERLMNIPDAIPQTNKPTPGPVKRPGRYRGLMKK